MTIGTAEESDIDEALEAYWGRDVSETALSFVSREFNDSILPSLKATAKREKYTADQYKSMWMWAWSVTHRLFDAMHSYATDEKEKPRYFWHHQRFDVFHTHDRTRGIDITKDELLSVAATYLGHPEIRTNKMDWLFLDTIVFQELEAYGEQVFSTKAGTGTNWAAVFAQSSQAKYYGFQILFSLIGFGLNFLLLPVTAYYLAVHDHLNWAMTTAGMWLLSLALQAISYPARRRARRKAAALLQHLIDLYGILGNNTVSPRKLKETLDAAAGAGVVLDGAVFTIVDRLIVRDPTAFIPTNVS
jgi:hypothetical protein